MYQLFLDANTYLGFYSLSPADIEQLSKLAELLGLGRLRLLVPGQVVDEVRRNRARVVSDRLKPLLDARIQVSIPQMALGTPLATVLRKAASETQRAHSRLMDDLRTAAIERRLPADQLIERLFGSAAPINDNTAILKATTRKALGNPPGKGSSLGDSVNWEVLLSRAERNQDLCFVSADKDFSSPLDPTALDEFLAEEWTSRKNAHVQFYTDIKQFLDDKFPQIRLTSDVRKYFLIDALTQSTSFAESHTIVADLNRYDSFSQEEALRLLSGGMENNQVRWLAEDEDVKELLGKALGPHRSVLPKGLVDRWTFLMDGRGGPYGPVPTDDDLQRPPPDPQQEPLF